MSEYLNASKFSILQDHVKDKGLVSGLNRISKQLIKAHYDGYHSFMSRQLALSIKRYIDRKPRHERKTPEFVAEIHRKLLCLHEYNLQVAKVKKYPRSNQLNQLLIRYIELECELLYRGKGEVDKISEDAVERRVFRLIQVILSNAIHNNEFVTKSTRDACLKVILKLFVNVRADCATENKLVPKVLVKLVEKMGHLAEIEALQGKNIPCHQDTYLSDPRTLRLRQNLTTSDYETNESDSEDESDSELPPCDMFKFFDNSAFKPVFFDSSLKNVITIELTDDEDDSPSLNSFKTNHGAHHEEIKVEFSDESNSSRSGNSASPIENSNHRHIETVRITNKSREELLINSSRTVSGRQHNNIVSFPKSSNKDLIYSTNKQCCSTQAQGIHSQNCPRLTGRNEVEATFLNLEPKIEDINETKKQMAANSCSNLRVENSSLRNLNINGASVPLTSPHSNNDLIIVDNLEIIEILDDDDDEINYGEKQLESSLNQFAPIKLEENEENHSPNFPLPNSKNFDQQLISGTTTKESGSSTLDVTRNTTNKPSEEGECREVAVEICNREENCLIQDNFDNSLILPSTNSVCDDLIAEITETSIDKQTVELQQIDKKSESTELASEIPEIDCSVPTAIVGAIQVSQNDALIEDFDSSKIDSPPLTEIVAEQESKQQVSSETVALNPVSDVDLRVETIEQPIISAQEEITEIDEAPKVLGDNTFVLSEVDEQQKSSAAVEDAAVANSYSPEENTQTGENKSTPSLNTLPEVTEVTNNSQEDEISLDNQETPPKVCIHPPLTPMEIEDFQTIAEEIPNIQEVQVFAEEVEVTVPARTASSSTVDFDFCVTFNQSVEEATPKVTEEVLVEDSNVICDDLNVSETTGQTTAEDSSASEIQDVAQKEKLIEETEDEMILAQKPGPQELEASVSKMEELTEVREPESLLEKTILHEVTASLETIVEESEITSGEVATIGLAEVETKEAEISGGISECRMSPQMISQEVEVETSTVDGFPYADSAYDTPKKADALVFFANVAASQEVLAVKSDNETTKPVTSRTRSLEKSGSDKKFIQRKTLQRAVKQKKPTKISIQPLDENKRNTRSATSRRESREASKSPRNSETKFRPYDFVFAQDTSPPPTNIVYDQKTETNLTSEDSNDSCGLIIDLKLEKEKEAEKSYYNCFEEETIDDLLEFVITEKAPVICISIPESDSNYMESNAILKQMEAFVDGSKPEEPTTVAVDSNEITTVHKKFNRAKYIKNMGLASGSTESNQLEDINEPETISAESQEVEVLPEVNIPPEVGAKIETTPAKKTDHSIATILKTPANDTIAKDTNEIPKVISDYSNTCVSVNLLDSSSKPNETVQENPVEVEKEKEQITEASTDEVDSSSSLSTSLESEGVVASNDGAPSLEHPLNHHEIQVDGDLCEKPFKSKGALKSFDELRQPLKVVQKKDNNFRVRVRSKSLNEIRKSEVERDTSKDDMFIISKNLRVTLELNGGRTDFLKQFKCVVGTKFELQLVPSVVSKLDFEERVEESMQVSMVVQEKDAIPPACDVHSITPEPGSENGSKAEQEELQEIVTHEKTNVEHLPPLPQDELIPSKPETQGGELVETQVKTSTVIPPEPHTEVKRRRKQLLIIPRDSESISAEIIECAEIVVGEAPAQKDTSPVKEIGTESLKCSVELKQTLPVVLKGTKLGKSVDTASSETCTVTQKSQDKEKGLENAIKKIKEFKEKALSQQLEPANDAAVETKNKIAEITKSRSSSIEKRDKRDSKSKDNERRRSSSKPRSLEKTRSDKEKKTRSRSTSKSRIQDKKSSETRKSDEHKDRKIRSRSSSKSKSLDKKIGGEKNEEPKRSSSRTDNKSSRRDAEKRDHDGKRRSRSSSKAKSLDGASGHGKFRSRSSSKSKSVETRTKEHRKNENRSHSKPKSPDSKIQAVRVVEVPTNGHRKRSRSTSKSGDEMAARTKRSKHEDKEKSKSTSPSVSKEKQTNSDVESSKIKVQDESKKLKLELKPKESEKSKTKGGECNEEKNVEKSRSKDRDYNKEKNGERTRSKATEQNKEKDVEKLRSKVKDKNKEKDFVNTYNSEQKKEKDNISHIKEASPVKGKTIERSRSIETSPPKAHIENSRSTNIEQFIESYIRRSRSKEKDQCKEKKTENVIPSPNENKGIENDQLNPSLTMEVSSSEEKCQAKIGEVSGKSKDQKEEKCVETSNGKSLSLFFIETTKEGDREKFVKEKSQAKTTDMRSRTKSKDQSEARYVDKVNEKDIEPKKGREDERSKEKCQLKEKNIEKIYNKDKDIEKNRNKDTEPSKEDEVEKRSVGKTYPFKENIIEKIGSKIRDETEKKNLGDTFDKKLESHGELDSGKFESKEKSQAKRKDLVKPRRSSKDPEKEINFEGSPNEELSQDKAKNIEPSSSKDTDQNKQKEIDKVSSKDRKEDENDFRSASNDQESGNISNEVIKSHEESAHNKMEEKLSHRDESVEITKTKSQDPSQYPEACTEIVMGPSKLLDKHEEKGEVVVEQRTEVEHDNNGETRDRQRSNTEENTITEVNNEKEDELKLVNTSVDINENCEKRHDRSLVPTREEEVLSIKETASNVTNTKRHDNSDMDDDNPAKKLKLHDHSPTGSEITLPTEFPQETYMSKSKLDVESSGVENLETSIIESSLVENSLTVDREIEIPSVILEEPPVKPADVFDADKIAIPPCNVLNETEKPNRDVIGSDLLTFEQSQIVPYVNQVSGVETSETVVEPTYSSELIESCPTILPSSSSMKLEPLLRNAISSVTPSAEQVFVSSTYSSFVLSGTVNETCKTMSNDPPLLPKPNQPKAMSIHCGIISQSVNIVNASNSSTVPQEDKSCLYTYNEETIISPTKLGIGSNQSLDLIPPSTSIPEITGPINLQSLVLNNISEDSGESDNVADFDVDPGCSHVGGPMVSGRTNEQKHIPTALTITDSPEEFITLENQLDNQLVFPFNEIEGLDEYTYTCKTEKPDFESSNEFSIMHPDVSTSKPDDIPPPSHLDLVEPQNVESKNSGVDTSMDHENVSYSSVSSANDFAINKLLKLTEDGSNSLARLPHIDHINIMEPSKELLEDPVSNVLCDPPISGLSYESFISKENNKQKVVVEPIEQFPVILTELKENFSKPLKENFSKPLKENFNKPTSEVIVKVPEVKKSVEISRNVSKLTPPLNKIDTKINENPLLKVDMEKLTGRRHSRTPVATSTPKNLATQQKSGRAPYKISSNTKTSSSSDHDAKNKSVKSISDLLEIPGAINSNLASRLRLRKDLIKSPADSSLNSILHEDTAHGIASEVISQPSKSSPTERNHWSEKKVFLQTKSNDVDIEGSRKRKYEEKMRQDKRRKSQEADKDTDTIFNELLKQGPTNKFFPLPSGHINESRLRNDNVTSETNRDNLGLSSHRSSYTRPSAVTNRESVRFLESDQRRDVRRQSHYLNNAATNRRLGEKKHQNDESSSRRVIGNSSRSDDHNSNHPYVRPQDRRLNSEQLKNITPNKTVTNPKFREQNDDEHLWRKKLCSVLDFDEGPNLFTPPKNKNRDMSP